MNPQIPFHPAVTDWFAATFAAPTPAQADAWPAIKQGRDVLIAAPTGSGKTLAAFLAAIDDLVREGEQWGLPDETRILYVSPLKALSNDISKNLRSTARRDSRTIARAHRTRCRDPRLGSHGRHAAVGASESAQAAAAYRGHDTRVAVHPARLDFRSRDAQHSTHGDRR